MSAAARTRRTLYYCVSFANGGLVFATPERAEEIDQLNQAIAKSRTWGDFRKAMPEKEYEAIVAAVFDEIGDERPEAEARFNAADVPGFCDGDYPPWLQTEMEDVLPSNVIARFGRQEPTIINGWYVHFDPQLEDRIVAMLRGDGYEVVERGDLMFC